MDNCRSFRILEVQEHSILFHSVLLKCLYALVGPSACDSLFICIQNQLVLFIAACVLGPPTLPHSTPYFNTYN